MMSLTLSDEIRTERSGQLSGDASQRQGGHEGLRPDATALSRARKLQGMATGRHIAKRPRKGDRRGHPRINSVASCREASTVHRQGMCQGWPSRGEKQVLAWLLARIGASSGCGESGAPQRDVRSSASCETKNDVLARLGNLGRPCGWLWRQTDQRRTCLQQLERPPTLPGDGCIANHKNVGGVFWMRPSSPNPASPFCHAPS